MGGQRHAPAALPPEKDPVPIVQEAGWPPGPFWTGAENLAPTGIRFPDRPALSESQYRLSYPGPLDKMEYTVKMYNTIFLLLPLGVPIPSKPVAATFQHPPHPLPATTAVNGSTDSKSRPVHQ